MSAQTALERGRKMVTTHEVEFYIYILCKLSYNK